MRVCVCLPAPVSHPAVSQKCLSPEQREVNCSSGGDGVEFILTLDGRLLKNNTDQSLTWSTAEQGESSVSNITINGQWSGKLTCRVENKVSTDETVIHLKSCKGTVFQVRLFSRHSIKSLLLFLIFIPLKMIKWFFPHSDTVQLWNPVAGKLCFVVI